MEKEEIEIITRYISAWNWHLIAVMLLIASIILAALHGYVYMLGTIFVMGIAEYMALTRQGEIWN